MSQGVEFGALIGSCSSISGASFSCSLNALGEQIKAQFLQCHRQSVADILSFLLVHPLSQHQPIGLLPTAVTELWVICVPEAKGGSQLLPPPPDVRGDQVHFTLLQVRGEELSRRGLKHLLLNCKSKRKERVCVIKNVCEERMCVPTSESQSHTHTHVSCPPSLQHLAFLPRRELQPAPPVLPPSLCASASATPATSEGALCWPSLLHPRPVPERSLQIG